MRRGVGGFTLVEILIVVLILAILAAIVLPRLWNASDEARRSTLLENISKIRAVIQVYRNQHGGLPDGDRIADQLTCPTDFGGAVGAVRGGGFRYGPYLEQLPPNPFTGSRAIRSTADPSEAFPPGDADGGWWYNEATGRFYCDLLDGRTDGSGRPYNRY
jgi:prepilin-type N-terminal cleavage/methylation domain-containing protein